MQKTPAVLLYGRSFVRLLRAINKLFLYQEVLKQNIGYYIILILIFNRSIDKADR